jgi:prepilin-type processing-associated H-X9-DG protein
MEPYIKNWSIYLCPSGGSAQGIFSPGNPLNNKNNMMRFAHLGFNYAYLARWGGSCAFNDVSGVSLAAVAKPAETVAFADSRYYSTTVGTNTGDSSGYAFLNPPNAASYFFPAPDVCVFGGGGNGRNGTWDWPAGRTEPTELGYSSPRHNGGMNVTFADGHAKWMKHQALAAGTNWGPGVVGAALVVNNLSQFIWDLE